MKRICLLIILVVISWLNFQKTFANPISRPVFSFSVGSLPDDFMGGNQQIKTSRTDEILKESTNSVSIITSDEINPKGTVRIKEILIRIPGIDIADSGHFGGASSVFIRGTESNHTLILIDGIKLYDAISPKAYFDIAFLTTDNIERIEIIKGPQSGLYGSDAIGGVINIITKKGRGSPNLKTYFETGSHQTYLEKINTQGQIKNLSFSFAASHTNSKGISQAGEQYQNTEKDKYSRFDFSGRMDFKLTENIDLTSTVRYLGAKFDIDDAGGYGGDDTNRINTKNQYVLGFDFNHRLTGWWRYSLKLSQVKENRTDDDDPDTKNPAELLRSDYESMLNSFGVRNNFKFVKWFEIATGLEHSTEKGNYYYNSSGIWGPYIVNFEDKKTFDTGYYLTAKFNVDKKIFAEIAARQDNHSEFKNHFTYKYGLAFLSAESLKLYASYGTGFKAASLFQLYSDYGNIDLKPEESTGFDFGVNFYSKNINFQTAFFRNDLKNMIDYDFLTWKYLNFTKVRTYGVESSVTVKPAKILTVKFGYTYLDAKNVQTGEPLVRRAKNKFNLDLNAEIKNINLNFNAAHFAGRYDKTGFPAVLIKLKNYTKIDFVCLYKITKNIILTGKIINLTDQTYELIKGYGTLRRSYYGGVKAEF